MNVLVISLSLPSSLGRWETTSSLAAASCRARHLGPSSLGREREAEERRSLSLCVVFADLTELAMQLSGKAARALECSVDQLDRSAEKQIKGYRLSASGGI